MVFCSIITDAFSAGIGRVGGQYVGLLQKQNKGLMLLAQDAALQLDKANELMTDPQNGLLSQQGMRLVKRLSMSSHFVIMLVKYHQHYLTILFDKSFMQQAQEMGFSLHLANRHEMGQIKAYEQDQFQSTLTLNAESAASMYGDNQTYISAHKQVFQQIEEFGLSHGWGEEQILAKKQKFKVATA